MAVYLGKNKMSFTGGQPVIFYGTDTSDATATENDITKDKIAYANGKRLVGTRKIISVYSGSSTPNASLGNDGDIYLLV